MILRLDFLQDLNCFEIKEIVNIYKKLQSNRPIDLPNKTKLDDLKKLFKLAVHQAVKGSASFELINKEIALTEDDFDPTKLSDLKTERIISFYTVKNDPKNVANEIRNFLYPDFNDNRKEFLISLINKLAEYNIFVFEFIETWNKKENVSTLANKRLETSQ